jgi:hypothetical protein
MSAKVDKPEEDIWAGAKRTRVWEGVDARTFRDEIQPLNRPAILKGLAAHWPAVAAAAQSPEALVAYLKGRAADRPIEFFVGAPGIGGRFSYGEDLKSFNFERRRAPLGEMLDLLLRHAADDAPPSIYAGAVNAPYFLPGIIGEIETGLIDPSTEQLVSLWIGNRTRTAAHWDLPQNIACIVAGRRRYTLLPAEQVKNLYIGPFDLTLAGRPTSLVDFHAPDFAVHPRFREAIAHTEIADLEPGDAVYVPSLWFHHVESMDPVSAMVNFWWRDAPAHMLSPYLTMLHSLLTIRDLPAPERAAWRAMFDHFVFQADGDPMAHLPEDVRGLWGAPTPEKIAQLKDYLIKTLR